MREFTNDYVRNLESTIRAEITDRINSEFRTERISNLIAQSARVEVKTHAQVIISKEVADRVDPLAESNQQIFYDLLEVQEDFQELELAFADRLKRMLEATDDGEVMVNTMEIYRNEWAGLINQLKAQLASVKAANTNLDQQP